jgi:hypothetical protein
MDFQRGLPCRHEEVVSTTIRTGRTQDIHLPLYNMNETPMCPFIIDDVVIGEFVYEDGRKDYPYSSGGGNSNGAIIPEHLFWRGN